MIARHFAVLGSVVFFSAASASAQTSVDDSVALAAEVQKLEGDWVAVAGVHCGKELSKEQLAQIKFSSGKGGYAIDLTPAIPVHPGRPGTGGPTPAPGSSFKCRTIQRRAALPQIDDWPTSYLLHLDPKSKQLSISRNVGMKGIRYYGLYEVKDDTLRIGFALTPWERSSADPSFMMYPPRDFATEPPFRTGMVSTVITFQRLKK